MVKSAQTALADLPWNGWLRFSVALLTGQIVLQLWSLYMAGIPAADTWTVTGISLWQSLLTFLRVLPLLLLIAWPLLRMRNRSMGNALLLALGVVYLLGMSALEHYFLAARVPLGADLFGYSLQEITTTVSAGADTGFASIGGWLLPLIAFGAAWMGLGIVGAGGAFGKWKQLGVALALVLAWLLPLGAVQGSLDAQNIAQNKFAFFARDNVRYFSAGDASQNKGIPGYPFVHNELTADTLGPFFNASETKPNLVFIVLEGMGRTFSGPDAPMGSFTPYLDELAGKSLYWDNFLAAQGRTFGVLPSLLGSLPYGKQGFTAMGADMPASHGLLTVLGQQDYQLRYLSNTSADFDNFRQYLATQGVTDIEDSKSFPAAQFAAHRFSEWGYDDTALAMRVEQTQLLKGSGPSVTVVQSIGSHDPFTFPDQSVWLNRVDQRIATVSTPSNIAKLRSSRKILSTVMAADDAVRRIIAKASAEPGFANTIFVITGDHRLPEIPMDTRIERYHVPLIIYSPLLKQPARFKQIASQLDVAPSLLALLSNTYGLKRPTQATWLGGAIGTDTKFGGISDIPLKQTKTLMGDYVSGTWYLSDNRLYRITDNMGLADADDPTTLAEMQKRLQTFVAENRQFEKDRKLRPTGTSDLMAYIAPAKPRANTAVIAKPQTLYTHDLIYPEIVGSELNATVRFTNAGSQSYPFVPLLVILDASQKEYREAYGELLTLEPGASASSKFQVDLKGIAPGDYFLVVRPSDPNNGKANGDGIYRQPLHIEGK